MRPNTLVQAVERIMGGAPRDVVLAEFASRNIFTEERPLRRARGPRRAENESR